MTDEERTLRQIIEWMAGNDTGDSSPTTPETPGGLTPDAPSEVAPVPLPAAKVLLAGALGVLAVPRRRS